MWRSTKFRISSGAALLLVLALLWGAAPVVPHVLVAAVCHELGHLVVLWCFHVPVEAVVVTSMWAVICAPDQERLSYPKELLAVLAGAGVNLLLAVIFARVSGDYLFGGANFLLGVYNLLPVQGLDGWRALYLLIAWRTEPFTAQRLAALVNTVVLAVLLGVSAALLYFTGSGLFCLVGAAGMIFGQFRVAKRERKR